MKRQRQTRPSRFSNQFQGKESSLGPRDQEGRLYAGMDWSKFKVQSLKKYAKTYELDVSNLSSKEELTSAIQRHWAQQVLNENEVLFNLGLACRKNANAANGR
ncbi:hypothetical protein WJX81_008166 [Elliptochloris bilobata]|uniref:Histone deacetylase complex subunit SAP30 Sin3 binding domain-containing protein n=1 Tax=Elliptochloris bilobata TaxID=381761 RepID=A0AAW1QXA2_9CHLO